MIHLQDNPRFEVGDRVKAYGKQYAGIEGEVIHIRETAGQYYLTVDIGDGITIGGNQNNFDRVGKED